MPEYDDIMRILEEHKDKTFVKRILYPEKFPRLDLGDGNYATHKMSWGEYDTPKGRKYVVYPTVLYDGKKLIDYGENAFDAVKKTGNFIEFDTKDRADWFSKRYKSIWEKRGGK